MPQKQKVRNWDCVFCGKSLRTYSDNARHILSHIGEKPEFCKLCGASFVTKKNLRKHRKARHQTSGNDERQRNFCCDICGKLFLAQRYLDRHQLTHLNKKPYQCDLCPAKFALSYYLVKHRKRHHPQQQQPRFNCKICGMELLRNKLTSHRLQFHPEVKLVRSRRKNIDTGETVKVKVKEERKLKKPIQSVWKTALEKLEAQRDQLITDIQLQEGQGQGERQRQEGEGHGEAIDLVATKKKAKSGRRKKKIKYKCRFCPASFRTMEFLENHFMTVHKGNVDPDYDNDDDEDFEEYCPVLFIGSTNRDNGTKTGN